MEYMKSYKMRVMRGVKMKRETDISVILVSVLYLILGIIFLVATEELIKAVNYTLVCICAIIGIIQLIQFFIKKKYKLDGDKLIVNEKSLQLSAEDVKEFPSVLNYLKSHFE